MGFANKVMKSREGAEDWLMTAEGMMHTLLNVLANSERHGSHADYPEGSRYIKISDTFANSLSKRLGVILASEDNPEG